MRLTMLGRTAAALAMIAGLLGAQTAPAPGTRAVGMVTAVTPDQKKLTIKTDTGETVSVSYTDKSRIVKIAAGETDMKKATPLPGDEIAVGDRALAAGTVAEADKVLTARLLVITAKSDVAAKQKAEADEWSKRGATGVVTSVDAAAKQFKVKRRSGEQSVETVVTLADKVDIKRYADDSVKYSDAKEATLADMKTNDQVRFLGNKSEDGLKWTGERVIFGSFRTLAGRVKSVNAAEGLISLEDLDGKPLLVQVGKDTSLKKMQNFVAFALAMQLNPTMKDLAARMASAQSRGGNGGGGQRQGGAPQGGPGGGAGAGGGFGGGAGMPSGPMTPQQISTAIDRSPKFELATLQPGDALIISASPAKVPGKATAITVLAGVDAILVAIPDIAGGVSAGLGQIGQLGVAF